MTATTNKLDVGAMMSDEPPAARRMREKFDAKYGDMSNIMRAINGYFFVVEKFRRPYNDESTERVTNADLDRAKAEMLASIRTEAALLSASKPAVIDRRAEKESNAEAELAFSVYSGLNALRWLLNITTEFDRKDLRTRQAARLLDEYMDSFGQTNRERLEDMWKTLDDKLPDDGRIAARAAQPAQTERALTDAQREAIGWACGASKHSGAPEVASYHQIFEKMLSAAQPASGVDHE
jgi:hypothetical protein